MLTGIPLIFLRSAGDTEVDSRRLHPAAIYGVLAAG